MKGFDCELISSIGHVDVPVIASGGMGSIQHALDVLDAGADAIAFASVIHYNRLTLQEIRDGLAKSEFQARRRGYEGRNEARPEGRV